MNNKDSSLVSVIIPTYKRPDRLKRAINSVRSQTYNNWEIIVIDDNDEKSEYRKETQEFMEQYSSIKNIIYLKHAGNQGGSMARNTGIEKANGVYIAFLDDDDEFLPEKIEKQVQIFQNTKYNNLGAVYCKSKKVDEKGKLLSYSIVEARGNAIKYHLLRNITPAPSIMIKKEALSKIGGFKKLISGQEYELMLRFFSAGYEIDLANEVLVVFHVHDQERISTGDKKIESLNYLFSLKKEYFQILSKKEIQKITNLHYLSLYQQYFVSGEKNQAFKHLKLAYKADFNTRNFIETLSFIIGFKGVLRIKRVLHVIFKRIS